MMIPPENMKNLRLQQDEVGQIMVVSFLRDEENPHRVVAGQIQFMMGFKSNL